MAASTPGTMIPQARIAKCDPTTVYCDGTCFMSNPSWKEFSDIEAINILSGGFKGAQGRTIPPPPSSLIGLSLNLYESMLTDQYLATMRRT